MRPGRLFGVLVTAALGSAGLIAVAAGGGSDAGLAGYFAPAEESREGMTAFIEKRKARWMEG